MKRINFDSYAETYDDQLQKSLGGFGGNIAYYAEHKINIVSRNLRFRPERILEYGCGTGRNISYFLKCFPNTEIWGCDISDESLVVAQNRNPSANFFSLNHGELPEPACFDLILVAGVFHHISPSLRSECMRKIAGFLKHGGDLFVFENNPYNPVTRRIMKKIPFDADAVMLRPAEITRLVFDAGLRIVRKRYTLFFPAGMRIFQNFELLLGFIPLGGQYFFHVRKE